MLVGIQDEILRLHSMGLLKQLLVDKTTRTNIIWATDAYQEQGTEYQRDKEIKEPLITGQNSDVIKTRARKAMEQQSDRTRKHAEVFTPLWICQKMVRYADDSWFGKTGAFSNSDEQSKEYISFSSTHKWQNYVDARRLEITCGEAPYLVNRYDVSTGESILLENREGILDRKLQVVNENIYDEAEWLKWVIRAFQSTYGYEFQGDNVLIARVNLLMTFEEYLYARWKRKPSVAEYREIVKTIVWNIWQMDGLSGTIPYCKAEEEFHQFNLFEWIANEEYQEKVNEQPHCRIYDWRRGNSLEYTNVNTGGRNMKFDFVIGNPPYQQESTNNGRKPPIYNLFMDEAYKVANVIELITPARFLFNAGQTPKMWNQKMLDDKHFKVLSYEADASKIFANTEIKGGVVITIYDKNQNYGAIKVFTVHEKLNDIIHKVLETSENRGFLDTIISSRGNYRTTEQFKMDFPYAVNRLGKGTGNMIASNFFEKIPECYSAKKSMDKDNCIGILSRVNNVRTMCYIKQKYVYSNEFLYGYNVASPKSNGNGIFGEALTATEILAPYEGATDTFISIGSFATRTEAENLQKYIKTKFFRALLGVKKVTQDNPKGVWNMIPIQNFTPGSDIDWTKSIADIDCQLYIKYGLDDNEVAFIESHVKEMV